MANADCPFPLLAATPENTNFIEASPVPCAFRCEGTMVNQADLDNYNTLTVAVSGISWVLAMFVFLTWGLFAVKARQKMTFWVAFSSVAVTSCIFFPAVARNGASNVWCKDDLEGFTQEDGLNACVIQGMAVVFFGLTLCTWWWCSCFDLFCKLYLRKRDIAHYLKYYHIFSWSLASFCTIIILATGKFGYEQPRLWCFLAPDTPDAFEYVFFYGWVGALWITGTIMMFLVIWSIISHSTASRGKGSGGKIIKKFMMYRTPLIFVFIFSIFWAVFFTFIIVVNSDEQAFIDDATGWITCLLAAHFGAEQVQFPHNTSSATAAALGFPNGCGDTQPNGISHPLLTTAVLALTGNGVLVFLIFGLQSENFVLWGRWLSSGCSSDSTIPKHLKITGQKSLSQFKELRIGLAHGTIYVCEKFAGLESSPAAASARQKTGNKAMKFDDEPVIRVEGSSYEGFDNMSPPVSPMPGMMDFPRHSYQQQRGEMQDPFPTRRQPVTSTATIPLSPAPPGLEQFYNTNNSSRQQQQQTYEQDHNSGGWSDIYNDPLWGINVEF